jgi:hypothetical protein
MKKRLLITLFAIAYSTLHLHAAPDFYLLTVGKAKEVYAMYGHTAIRVVDTSLKMDFIVDWGVFDFDQPDFYLNFARGKMLYTTSDQAYQHFVMQNEYYGKGLVSRQIFLSNDQKENLFNLIINNLRPGNRDYYYKFIQDNCATRPRDLIEAAVGKDLIYPVVAPDSTFRDILHKYQQTNLWYNLLIDIILGSPLEEKADFRAQMFIPDYLENNMAQARVRYGSDSTCHRLLGDPEVIVEQEPVQSIPKWAAPEVCFSLLFLLIVLLDYFKIGKWFFMVFDVLFFSAIIVFGLVIIFLWGFTDHQEAYNNYNIFWLNPLFIFPLLAALSKKKRKWLIITGFYVIIFSILAFVGAFPQAFPVSMYILLLIVLERCYASAQLTPLRLRRGGRRS